MVPHGGPLAINGVITQLNGHCKWVTVVITPVSGVITVLITGRGPALKMHLPFFRHHFVILRVISPYTYFSPESMRVLPAEPR